MGGECLDPEQTLPDHGLGQRRPLLVTRRVQRSLCQLEVGVVRVVHDQQTIPRRLDVVLDPVTTRRHHPGVTQRRRGVEQQHLGGQLGTHLDDDPGVVARGPDPHPEPLVRLLEDQDIVLRRVPTS